MPILYAPARISDTLEVGNVLTVTVNGTTVVERRSGQRVIESARLTASRSFGPFMHDTEYRISVVSGTADVAESRSDSEIARRDAIHADVAEQGVAPVSIFKFLSAAQRSDVVSRAALVPVTDAVQDAIDEAKESFGAVWFPPGKYRLDGPLEWHGNVRLFGPGFHTIGGVAPAEIVNSDTDIFLHTDTAQRYGQSMYGLSVISLSGGGHIFVAETLAAEVDITHCRFQQINTGKSILQAYSASPAGSYYGGCSWRNVEFDYPVAATVPAFNLKLETINQVVFDDVRSLRGTIVAGGEYAFDVECTGPSATVAQSVAWRDCVFQQPGGGAIRLMGGAQCLIENSGVYDLTTGSSNPIFKIGTSAAGLASARIVMRNVFCNAGTVAEDVQVDTAAGGSSLHLDNCRIGRINGLDSTGAHHRVSSVNSTITTVTNCGIASYSAGGPVLANPNGLMTSFEIQKGAYLNFDGYARVLCNGAYASSWVYQGEFRHGGTPTSPNIQLTTTGNIYANSYHIKSDVAAAGSHVALSNSQNTGTARGAGVGTILFADGTSRNSVGFLKVYIGATPYYMPLFAAN